jgi:hypothetical protein
VIGGSSPIAAQKWLFSERKRLAEPGAVPADARYLKGGEGAFGVAR